MMRTTLGLAATSVVAASLIGTASGAAAAPPAVPNPVPAAIAESGTGSSMADSGSAAAQSLGWLAERGDIIGIIVLLGITPFQMFTGGVCDLATLSALPNPCAPRVY